VEWLKVKAPRSSPSTAKKKKKKKKQKRSVGVTQSVCPEFKPYYCQKQTQFNSIDFSQIYIYGASALPPSPRFHDLLKLF
jgi:hypothetical protein